MRPGGLDYDSADLSGIQEAPGELLRIHCLGWRITAGVGLAGVLATLVALFMLPDSSAVVSVQVGVVFFAIISVFYVVLAKKRGGFPRADLDALAEQQKEDA